MIVALFNRAHRLGVTVDAAHVNGEPGLIVYDQEHKVVRVFSLDILGGLVQTVRVSPIRTSSPILARSDIARTRYGDEDRASSSFALRVHRYLVRAQ